MRLSLGSVDTVAQAIQTMEGYYAGSATFRTNNPGALMYAGQSGSTGADPATGLAIFPDYATGYQALLNQINLDASRGLTIDQFTAKYAPAAAGNNPGAYAMSIASATGLSPSDPLSMALSDGSAGIDPTTGLPLDTSNLGDAAGSGTFTAAAVVGGAMLLLWLMRG
jgi:hypothetical protein